MGNLKITKQKLRLDVFLFILISTLNFFNLKSFAKKSTTHLLSDEQIKKNINSKRVTTRQNKQVFLTNKYKEKAQSNKYTFKNPYTKLNPYKTSPLTALIDFKTAQPTKVSYIVKGKQNKFSIKNQENGGYKTQHQLPIVGLYPNFKNQVKVNLEDQNGHIQSKTFYFKTKKLPKYIKDTKISVSKKRFQKWI